MIGITLNDLYAKVKAYSEVLVKKIIHFGFDFSYTAFYSYFLSIVTFALGGTV